MGAMKQKKIIKGKTVDMKNGVNRSNKYENKLPCKL